MVSKQSDREEGEPGRPYTYMEVTFSSYNHLDRELQQDEGKYVFYNNINLKCWQFLRQHVSFIDDNIECYSFTHELEFPVRFVCGYVLNRYIDQLFSLPHQHHKSHPHIWSEKCCHLTEPG